jgi:hypothetical protein
MILAVSARGRRSPQVSSSSVAPFENLAKARRIRTEKATARRLAGELEREAADLHRASTILRRRAV